MRQVTSVRVSAPFIMATVAASVVGFTGCASSGSEVPDRQAAPGPAAIPTIPVIPTIPTIPFTVVASYPHDPNAWTQGLAYAGTDRLFEGTGYYEQSSLREVVRSTGEVLRLVRLPSPQMFGEGITAWGDKIVQLTWRDGVGLVYQATDFTLLRQFRYPAAGADLPREGWGITSDGIRLFVSDGSASVYVADAQQTLDTGELVVTDVLTVRSDGQPVERINELEYVDGVIYANVWHADTIVRFDAATGLIDGRLDISGLLSAEERETADTSNGIAFDPETGELLVTGKRWPRLFALQLD